MDDIGYSISVGVARREQDLDDEDWQESFGAEFELDWPDANEEEERERLAEVPDEELRDELERIDDEIAEWRDVYDVETPDELRETINEGMEPDEHERRLEVAYDWEYNLYMRRLILSVAYQRNANRAAETNEEWSSVRTDGIDCRDSDDVFADEELHDDERDPSLQDVLKVMGQIDGPRVTASDVSIVLGCSESTARRRLTELFERGYIEQEKKGQQTLWWRAREERNESREAVKRYPPVEGDEETNAVTLIESDDEPAGKVRERVRQVLSSLSKPAKVSTIAEMADCSAEGARNSLREYREMGLVVKTNDNPEMYERNPAYFQFLRGHRLAQEHSTEELREQLAEKYREHRAFADRFDAQSPEEVEVDERESRERFDAVFEWEALLSEADDLREAYRQQTDTMPTAIEDLPTGEWSEVSVEANLYLGGDDDS